MFAQNNAQSRFSLNMRDVNLSPCDLNVMNRYVLHVNKYF